MLAETWFCEAPEADRVNRLVTRHEPGGRSTSEAQAWADNVDGRNARLVEATRARADLVIGGTEPSVLEPSS